MSNELVIPERDGYLTGDRGSAGTVRTAYAYAMTECFVIQQITSHMAGGLDRPYHHHSAIRRSDTYRLQTGQQLRLAECYGGLPLACDEGFVGNQGISSDTVMMLQKRQQGGVRGQSVSLV